jgi:hypothetical protein
MKIIVIWHQNEGHCNLVQRQTFLNQLEAEWHPTVPPGATETSFAAEMLWTSTKLCNGKEFCSIFSAAMRDDRLSLARACSVIAKAINESLVNRPVDETVSYATAPTPACFPDGPLAAAPNTSTTINTVYRGGGFGFPGGANVADIKAFFEEHVGKNFRVQSFLPTSFSLDKARSFMRRASAPHQQLVLWIIELDDDHKTYGGNKISDNHTHAPGEAEFLFTAYSVFQVVDVTSFHVWVFT